MRREGRGEEEEPGRGRKREGYFLGLESVLPCPPFFPLFFFSFFFFNYTEDEGARRNLISVCHLIGSWEKHSLIRYSSSTYHLHLTDHCVFYALICPTVLPPRVLVWFLGLQSKPPPGIWRHLPPGGSPVLWSPRYAILGCSGRLPTLSTYSFYSCLLILLHLHSRGAGEPPF